MVVLIPIFGSVALERFLRAATLAPITADLVIIYPPERYVWILAWTLPVTLIIACAAMATKTWLRAIVQAAMVLTIVAAGLFVGCYANFIAARAAGSKIELVYLWPRPSTWIDPRGAVLHEEETLRDSNDTSFQVYRLVIEVHGRTYRSEYGAVDQLKKLLLQRGATGGELR